VPVRPGLIVRSSPDHQPTPSGAHTAEGAWTGYLILALVAALRPAGYLRTRIVGLLVVGLVGVVALAAVVPEAAFHHTDGALSTAGALLVSGLSIVGAGALGFRLRREVAARD
jgi:hypothetical protein